MLGSFVYFHMNFGNQNNTYSSSQVLVCDYMPWVPCLNFIDFIPGDNVDCQAFPRDYRRYGTGTSRYDKAYCSSHIDAYDKEFRNATHTFTMDEEARVRTCATAEPSRLWQNIIPTIFILIACANYIPTFIANTFLRDKILSYLLFIKHTVDQGYGDLERVMKFASTFREGVDLEEEDNRFKELEKQCFKWRGNDLAAWYFVLNFIRLVFLVGELLMFGLVKRIRFDEIRQDFICCVDRQHPVHCTFSKYYTLLIFWAVTVGALSFSVLITLKGILSIFMEIPCNCTLCQHHTLNMCKQCSESWCEEHGDGCEKCGECLCRPDCKSHVYSRICGSRVPCPKEEVEVVEGGTITETKDVPLERSAPYGRDERDAPYDRDAPYGRDETGTPYDRHTAPYKRVAPSYGRGSSYDADAAKDVEVNTDGENIRLRLLDGQRRRPSQVAKPRAEPEDKGRWLLKFPMDYHFISHLCYANCHAMKLLMIVNVMDHLAGTISEEKRERRGFEFRFKH